MLAVSHVKPLLQQVFLVPDHAGRAHQPRAPDRRGAGWASPTWPKWRQVAGVDLPTVDKIVQRNRQSFKNCRQVLVSSCLGYDRADEERVLV